MGLKKNEQVCELACQVSFVVRRVDTNVLKFNYKITLQEFRYRIERFNSLDFEAIDEFRLFSHGVK